MVGETTSKIAGDEALNLARQSLYRFGAVSLLDPRAHAWQRLAAMRDCPVLDQAAVLVRELPAAVPDQLARGELPIIALDPVAVLNRLPATQQALNDEFEALFGLLVSNACPPYETEYINSKFTFQRSNTLADVSGFYQAFGLTTADAHPERPDHIVLELEFMAVLVDLEQRAVREQGELSEQRRQTCREAQRHFLRDHLAWWTPAFARLLRHEAEGTFYEAVGKFLAAWIPAERALLGVPAPMSRAVPSSIEQPEACDGCQLAAAAD
jgi:TorA maturation chaperone TorD